MENVETRAILHVADLAFPDPGGTTISIGRDALTRTSSQRQSLLLSYLHLYLHGER